MSKLFDFEAFTRWLAALCAKYTIAGVARAVRVSPVQLGLVFSGVRRPTHDLIRRTFAAFTPPAGIIPASLDHPTQCWVCGAPLTKGGLTKARRLGRLFTGLCGRCVYRDAGRNQRVADGHMGLGLKDETGHRYGDFVVVEFAGVVASNARWLCLCAAGHFRTFQGSHLRSGAQPKCRECSGPTITNVAYTSRDVTFNCIGCGASVTYAQKRKTDGSFGGRIRHFCPDCLKARQAAGGRKSAGMSRGAERTRMAEQRRVETRRQLWRSAC